jgi:nucleoid-associated protein YgaU
MFRVPVEAGTRVVLRGDSLWSIAAEQVRAALDRSPTDHEVGRYWVQLVEENRSRLASGDPDLILPGEILRLPPLA